MSRRRSASSIDKRNPVDDNFVITAYRGGVLPELSHSLQRVGHTIVVYKHDLYLYGGYGVKNIYPTPIYCNVKMTLQWKEMRGVGVVPCGRANHSAIVYENKMIIFGGHRNLDVLDDLYIINLDTMRWEKVNYEKGQGPGPVFSHVAVYVPPTQAMIVIGGFHQRQHNMYLAHSFDIRHRVWNGIRGPNSMNPLHIQMCSAVYHSSSASLIVIGLVEKDVLQTNLFEMPTIYMMNVHSCLWVEVSTPTSPESPIPFRMSGVWECFIREAISMGCAYDDFRQEWCFPMVLATIEQFLMRRDQDRVSTMSTVGSIRQPKAKFASYGFFKLSLRDMTWSLVPIRFPKRIIAELMARRMTRQPSTVDRLGPDARARRVSAASKKKTLPLYSVTGVSRFQRKYAMTSVESTEMRGSRVNHKVFVLHGGIGTEDYAMLLFTPILKRRASAASSVEGGYVAFSETETSFFSTSRFGSNTEHLSTAWDEEISVSDSDFTRVATDADKKGELTDTAMDEVDSNILVGRSHRLGSDPTLLPTLVSDRGGKCAERFAVLYHPQNAIHSDKLLPDSMCPVAVMDKKSDVKLWAENLYQETRQWIASRIEQEREAERAARGKKKRKGSGMTGDDDYSSSSESSAISRDSIDTKVTRASTVGMQLSSLKAKDFFLDKNLEVFDLHNVEIRRLPYYSKRPFVLASDAVADTIDRLHMVVKRTHEVQRLPTTVFQKRSLENVTDIGGATAHLVMTTALARCSDGSYESRRQRALIRWRYLRVMVLNGEASFIMHRIREEESKVRGVDISSTSQLTLAPELNIKGPVPRKVSTRPVPYTVPLKPVHTVHASEMTSGGLIMYHCFKSVK